MNDGETAAVISTAAVTAIRVVVLIWPEALVQTQFSEQVLKAAPRRCGSAASHYSSISFDYVSVQQSMRCGNGRWRGASRVAKAI